MRLFGFVVAAIGVVGWPVATEADVAPLYSGHTFAPLYSGHTTEKSAALQDACSRSNVARTATVSIAEATIRFGPGMGASLATNYSVKVDSYDRHVANCRAQGTTPRSYALVSAEAASDRVSVRFVDRHAPGDEVVMTGSIHSGYVDATYQFCATHEPFESCSSRVTVPVTLQQLDT